MGEHGGDLDDPSGPRRQLRRRTCPRNASSLSTSMRSSTRGAHAGLGLRNHRQPEQRGQAVRHLDMALAGDGDGLGNRQRRPQPRILERTAEPVAGALVGRPETDVHTVEQDGSRVGRHEPGHEVEEGGLAGSVRADDPEDLTVVDGEGDTAGGSDPAVALPNLPGLRGPARTSAGGTRRRGQRDPLARSPPPRKTARARSGRSSSSAVGPVKRTSPFSRKIARRARRSAVVTDCSTITTVVPPACISRDHGDSCSTTSGRETERQLVDQQQTRLAEEGRATG